MPWEPAHHLSPSEAQLRRRQRLDALKERRLHQREALHAILDAKRDFKGKLQNLVIATIVGLDEALLVEPPNASLILEYAERLGVIDPPPERQSVLFDETLLKKAYWALRPADTKRGKRELAVDDKRHPVEAPEDASRLRKDRIDTLHRMGYVCPVCSAKKLATGQWVWPKKDTRFPICRVCHYLKRGKTPGYKTDEQPPADNVCPGCKRVRPKRRQWSMRSRPIVCRRCAAEAQRV